MARKKTKSKPKKTARPAVRPKATARAKTNAKPAATPSSTQVSAKRPVDSEVERRWKEYWACRTKLEDAVETVTAAREALQTAQETERTSRAEFEVLKGSLTTLLDVDPAGGPQKPPTSVAQSSVARSVPPSPQSPQGPKPAS